MHEAPFALLVFMKVCLALRPSPSSGIFQEMPIDGENM
jgi:hypothetical protein